MKFAVVSNKEKDEGGVQLARVCGALERLGAQQIVVLDYEERFFNKTVGHRAFPEAEGCDIVLALGGDGTMLHVAKQAAYREKPVLGINTGRLGFMAGMEAAETDLLKNLFDGDYEIEDRMMLEVKIDGGDETFYALNDVVLTNGDVSKTLELALACNGRPITDYRADGLILSTPTGSTAYSLSAGGPIVDPLLDSICITPICPHSLVSRPILFSPDAQIRVQTSQRKREMPYVAVDGETARRISPGQGITAHRSPLRVHMIRLKDLTFYGALRNKLAEK